MYNVRRMRCDSEPGDPRWFGYQATLLNHNEAERLSGIDVTAVGATSDQLATAVEEMGRGGVIASGVKVVRTVPAGEAQGGSVQMLWVSQLYLPADNLVPKECGGFYYRPCPSGQWCDVSVPNACSGADLPGVCKTVPNACITVYDPVCGCDGRTYGNDCERVRAQVQLDHRGACVQAP